MTITEEELKELIKEKNADLEKITTLSFDGRNLLTRIPKEIVDFIKLKKGDKLRWLVKADSKKINLEITFGIVKLKMKKVYGDEIFRVESRLTDILTSGMLIPRKKELIKLLKKVNKIYAKSYDDFKEVLEESKKIMKSIIKNYPLEMMGYTYIFGKINVLTSMINSILDTINDYEEDNKMINKNRSLKRPLDGIDREILRFMNSANRGLTGNQIAKKVNLSSPAIKPRLVNLQNRGIVKPQMIGANRIWDNPRSLKRKIIAPSMIKWGLDLIPSKKEGSLKKPKKLF